MMKAVKKAKWDLESEHGSGLYYQKFIRAISAIIDGGGFIPPSVSSPLDNARYIIHCFSQKHQKDLMFRNDLSFEEHVEGISSVYTGPNGRLFFVLKQGKGVKTKAEINYDYNRETETAISLEHLGAMVSILGMPESFEVELTGADMDKILFPEYIESGAAKIGG